MTVLLHLIRRQREVSPQSLMLVLLIMLEEDEESQVQRHLVHLQLLLTEA
jgi:hypothetical protein